MNNIKKIIFFLAIIVFIIIVILSIVLFTTKKDSTTSETSSNIKIDSNTKNLSLLKDESEYQDIKRIFNKYMSYINYLDYNQFQVKLTEEKQKQIKNEYLEKGKEYLEKILIDNVTINRNWIDELSEYAGKKVDILEINKCSYNQITVYLLTVEYDKAYTENMIIFVDENSEAFSILPDKILNNISEDSIESILNDIKIENIEKNDYNELKKIKLDEERICLQYYYDYLDMLRSNTDKLYETINKEYREKRFENIENFKNYISNNKQKLEKAVLSSYQVKNIKDYVEYTCVDEEGRYYVFCATSAMKYTMYLDIYTVDLPEFTEKYNKSNDQEKVVLNINKITTALNAGDYKYVYDKLADSFKNNYFKNQEDFEEYWKNHLYKKFVVNYLDFAEEGNLYTYKIRITKEYEEGESLPEGKNSPSENLNIVMQLKEGTDFVMSFSVLD